MSQRIIIFVLLIVSCAFQLWSAEKTTIAILELEAVGVDKHEAKAITERVQYQIFQSGQYNVVERNQVDKVLEEQGFQQLACTSDQCVIEAGKVLGVQKMVAGSVSKMGDLLTITLKIINVELATVENMAQEKCLKCPIERFAQETCDEVVQKLLGVSLPTPTQVLQPSPLLFTDSISTETEPNKAVQDLEVRQKTHLPWLYIGGAAVLVAGGVTTYLILSEESKEEKLGRLTINVPSHP